MSAIEIGGWVAVGALLLWGTGLALYRSPHDAMLQLMMRSQGRTLILACVIISFLTIPKLWVLAAIPYSFVWARYKALHQMHYNMALMEKSLREEADRSAESLKAQK